MNLFSFLVYFKSVSCDVFYYAVAKALRDLLPVRSQDKDQIIANLVLLAINNCIYWKYTYIDDCVLARRDPSWEDIAKRTKTRWECYDDQVRVLLLNLTLVDGSLLVC